MRRGRDCGLLLDADGMFIGVNLGADYVSEHEWGIKELHEYLGISDKGIGVARRTITTAVQVGRQTVKGQQRMKAGEVIFLAQNGVDNYLKSELFMSEERDLVCAWDSKSFAIRTSKKHAAEMEELWQAFQRNDVAVWCAGGGVFQNAGLVIAIVSRIPADKAEKLAEADRDRIALTKAATKTGIEKRLEKAKLSWFALSPCWANTAFKPVETVHPVIFWLNPHEQNQFQSGWFTVEQLDEWAKGLGPVMKNKKQGQRT